MSPGTGVLWACSPSGDALYHADPTTGKLHAKDGAGQENWSIDLPGFINMEFDSAVPDELTAPAYVDAEKTRSWVLSVEAVQDSVSCLWRTSGSRNAVFVSRRGKTIGELGITREMSLRQLAPAPDLYRFAFRPDADAPWVLVWVSAESEVRSVHLREVLPYAIAHVWVDGADDRGNLSIHICSHRNGVSEMRNPEPDLVDAGFHAVFGNAEALARVQTLVEQALSTGDYSELSSERARVGFLRSFLSRELTADRAFTDAIGRALSSASLQVHCMDCPEVER